MYVDYMGMVPLIVNALNEIQAKVDSQETVGKGIKIADDIRRKIDLVSVSVGIILHNRTRIGGHLYTRCPVQMQSRRFSSISSIGITPHKDIEVRLIFGISRFERNSGNLS